MSVAIVTIVSEVDDPILFKKSFESYVDLVEKVYVVNNGALRDHKDLYKNRKNVQVIQLDEHVKYVELIRQQIHEQIKETYIFIIDPDEVVPTSLIRTLKKYRDSYNYIRIPRKNIIFGKWIEHARWWPDYQVRFFKNGSVTWNTEIHSQPDVTGEGFDLPDSEKNALEHYNYNSVELFISKLNRYAQSSAQEKIDALEPYSLLQAVNEAIGEFVSRFLSGQGYKDGIHGFLLAFIQMMYPILTYAYYFEKKDYDENPEDAHVLRTLPLRFFGKALKESIHWSNKEQILPENVSKLKSKILSRSLDSVIKE